MMTNSPHLEYNSAFDLLAPPVKKWVWKQGWKNLREIQLLAIPPLLEGRDTIIAAATAGGKTEAAFLPLLSRAFAEREAIGFVILYISPLKALINDQHRRLEGLCEDLSMPLTKWHGDVSANIKQKSLKQPSGVLLITPESLEAMLMNKAAQATRAFAGTQAIIIDELHAFMGTERGVQLRSVMNRIEKLVDRQIPRIGLSATLGDMAMAAHYLRSDAKHEIPIIEASSVGNKIMLQLRSYIEPSEKRNEDTVESYAGLAKAQIAEHLFMTLRGSHNLIFAGSKQNVEYYGATLRDYCEEKILPNEFFTHHANISKPDREALENRLKAGRLPTTAVCTSTLELGIDIGDVKSVAQIGCSGSVAALRQRMGRSGRRNGESAILRCYNISDELNQKSHILDYLYLPLVQAIAEIQLLLEGMFEPPDSAHLHLSTFVHQILALINERGGIRAKLLYQVLCQSAPFDNISTTMFQDILRAMASEASQLIEQAPDGTLLLGKQGEYLSSHYSFYAVFETSEEYRVVCNGKTLGTLPVMGPTAKNMLIIFSGRRWRILEVHATDKMIIVESAKGGNPPKFEGNGPRRHSILDEKMRKLLLEKPQLQFLNATAATLFESACNSYQDYQLQQSALFTHGDDVILFPWAGSDMIDTLNLLFQSQGYRTENLDYAITIKQCSQTKVKEVIQNLADGKLYDREKIATYVENKTLGKYDEYLTDDLLVKQLASRLPSLPTLRAWAKSVIKTT